MPVPSRLLGAVAVLAAAAGFASAFDMARTDNVVAYWGQNSHGASDPTDTAGFQKKLGDYCDDDTMDTFPISFLTVFFSTGNLPQLDLANICNANDGKVFPNSQLPDCSFLSDDIKKCQDKGKIVTLSMGGATGGNAFTSDDVARGFADQIWNLFLGGTSDTRPFGEAQLDGVDLDIEGGSGAGYIAFVEQLRTHYKSASKKYYVTAAPQCPFPDAILGDVLNGAEVDAVYVQFYNNYCSVSNYNDPNSWNYAMWDDWAQNKAPKKDVKIYIGAPGAPGGANPGSYVDAATLGKIATETRSKYPDHFGGVMYWDASQAVANSNFNKAIKDAIRSGDAPAPPPTTSAPPEDPTTTSAPPETTSAPADTTTTSAAPSETPAPGGGGEGEDPCPPEQDPTPTTSAPPTETTMPTDPEDPCPPEDPTTTTSSPPTETTMPSDPEDPCPPEDPTTTTSAPPTETSAPSDPEDPCPPEDPTTTTSAPPTETSAPSDPSDPCPPEDPTTTSTAAPAPTTSAPAPPTDCGSAQAWSMTVAYVGGDTASYNGKVYKAKWWTVNEPPDRLGVWEEAGACNGKRSNLRRAAAADPRVKVRTERRRL